MKQLICQEPKKLVYQQVEEPVVKAGRVKIKIHAVGICGTDIHAWGGNQPFFQYPRVLGHEISGTICAVADDIKQWKVGQRVAVMPYVACYECGACKSGKTNCCEKISVIGVHEDGGFCEYLNVPEKNILAIEDSVSDIDGALIEPFAISAHAVRRAQIKPHDAILVVGAGPIGLGVAAIAKADGANVLVADTSLARRQHVEKVLGIKTCDPASEDYLSVIEAYFGGMLAEKVIDATGNPHAMNNTVNLIRHGGKIIFVGLFKGNLSFSDPDFHKKETTMMGSRNATPEDFNKVARLMAEGKISSELMLTHQFDFDSIGERYEQDVINNRDLIKGVILF
ncbi:MULTISPECIES: zinc-binding alcohol dehydrogenase family protein [Providencia]|uniref:zinc-binding alcohol dehydrogenase family protein n=1 Tax=Providencia TaxID=586 RepID=UPI0021021096|nr:MULTISPECIES: zinc-binding alcohol dehydrogenase family protein [Providencia]